MSVFHICRPYILHHPTVVQSLLTKLGHIVTVNQTCNLVHVPQNSKPLVTYERCSGLAMNETRLFLLLHFLREKKTKKQQHICGPKGKKGNTKAAAEHMGDFVHIIWSIVVIS